MLGFKNILAKISLIVRAGELHHTKLTIKKTYYKLHFFICVHWNVITAVQNYTSKHKINAYVNP